jgi:hypothetical protein
MLFVQIPAFKKTVDADQAGVDASVLKPLPLLAAVHINHSHMGFLLYRCSYFTFALSLLLAFYNYVVDQPFWLLLLVFCLSGLWFAYRREITHSVTGRLSYSGDHWLLEQDGRAYQLELAGEVLCWSWLIILPLRDIADTKVRRVIIFGDALNKNDNARLRRWLRACLIPKA